MNDLRKAAEMAQKFAKIIEAKLKQKNVPQP
jgi:hypothetical protein